MSKSMLSAPHFDNEEAAYKFVESRIWPNAPVCPHCGCYERIGRMGGKSTRIGVHKCYDCRKPFTVKIRTIFEASHIPMRIWLQAIFLIASSKKGISSNQLHRGLGISLKSASFLSHRIREAMKDNGLEMFGENSGTVEVDETFIGRDFTKKPRGVKKGRGYEHKNKILSFVDRNSRKSRSIVVDNLKAKTLMPLLQQNILSGTRIVTDEAAQYKRVRESFADHAFVCHMLGEYVSKWDATVHTNTIEGFFSIFKRGMKGIYQHCEHNHLHRCLAEFDFRYNNRVALGVDDQARAENILQGVKGKRLTYQTTA